MKKRSVRQRFKALIRMTYGTTPVAMDSRSIHLSQQITPGGEVDNSKDTGMDKDKGMDKDGIEMTRLKELDNDVSVAARNPIATGTLNSKGIGDSHNTVTVTATPSTGVLSAVDDGHKRRGSGESVGEASTGHKSNNTTPVYGRRSTVSTVHKSHLNHFNQHPDHPHSLNSTPGMHHRSTVHRGSEVASLNDYLSNSLLSLTRSGGGSVMDENSYAEGDGDAMELESVYSLAHVEADQATMDLDPTHSWRKIGEEFSRLPLPLPLNAFASTDTIEEEEKVSLAEERARDFSSVSSHNSGMEPV